ncbi:MAG TPA: methyltransferase domain-containing protein [Ohtaekwangia sp.]|uniref:RsmB/NOP family class I SAM-dependent RNA methyltransferase n=1 Tax=Ohtaekwangia sp. TaxID=2066019 RepID=UPI002F939DA9
MKLYNNTTNAVVQALEMIFGEQRYADKVIEKVLKQNPKWGARDRRFIAETTYDIVRWYRLLREISGAGEHDYWKLLGAILVLQDIPLPHWEEFKGVNPNEIAKRKRNADKVRKVRESIPDWLDEMGEKEIGKLWDKELKSLNDEAKVVLRVNTLKTNKKDLRERLLEENVETYAVNGFEDALLLKERQNVFGIPAFKGGLFEVQDAASQLIAPFLKIEPGQRVIDACAGAGGKTLHIAALMKNKGRIIGMDTEEWKLQELQKRARRGGVTNLETRIIDSSKVIKRLENSADRLLLDVPCSGLGVLKRNPDAKWKLSEEFIKNVKELQQHILQDYCQMVKPGGLIVYSTCSILPSENQHQVKTFLENNPDKYELLEQQHAWPSDGYDGFYMALLKRR